MSAAAAAPARRIVKREPVTWVMVGPGRRASEPEWKCIRCGSGGVIYLPLRIDGLFTRVLAEHRGCKP